MVPHPIIVDFAVALLVVSVGFDALAGLVEQRDLRLVAWWTLMVGTVAAGLSVVSGYAAARSAVDTPVITETIAMHRNLGIAALIGFAACCAWRIHDPGGFPERFRDAYWLLAALALGTLVLTAYFGGILVFKFGVGVLPPT